MSIERLFVADRGEIAVRVLRTCRELGIEAVLGVSVPDRESMAAELADRVVVLGPGHASESYLKVPAVIQAALGTGCDAIHPGYGFLAENPALPRAASEHGLCFVGPPPAVVELAGDKLRAREVAERTGLPIVPGREVASAADCERFADQVGYPVLVKAAGGGGGRGIKLATSVKELRSGFAVAQAEAGAAFGDQRLFVERFIRTARHLEVQVAADDGGDVVHIGERDCSTQRRYQKLIEEAPAPKLDPGLRGALTEAAVAFARAIGYRNVGTVEFVADVEAGSFYFLEMNCRIQVEHPVTEALCGRDLVALQLRIANGLPLGFEQADVVFKGHAVEARVVAEDPDRGFAPAPGAISRFDIPELPGLRVDTHCRAGTVIPPYYDSLLAKLIAHAGDRETAIETLSEGLELLRVEGVPTNVELLSELLRDERFRSGDVTTRWLEEAIA